MTTIENKILTLEVLPNGESHSLIADDGTIYATGYSSRELLREAGFAARDRGYEYVMIGTQRWDVARLIELA